VVAAFPAGSCTSTFKEAGTHQFQQHKGEEGGGDAKIEMGRTLDTGFFDTARDAGFLTVEGGLDAREAGLVAAAVSATAFACA